MSGGSFVTDHEQLPGRLLFTRGLQLGAMSVLKIALLVAYGWMGIAFALSVRLQQ